MATFVRSLAGLVGGYVVGAAIGLAMVALFSTNTHDKNVEMVMTAAFVAGPIGAVMGVIAALITRRG